MRLRLFLIAVILMAMVGNAHAWVIIGKVPPSAHTVQLGTFQIYKSDGGAVRYLAVKETKESICGKPEPLEPSTTYKNAVEGFYKEYKSPTGAISRWPVSFATECYVPESEEPNPPAPDPDVDFTGLLAVAINPTFTEPNDCTYAEFQVTKKNVDNTYMISFKRIYDAAQITNGVRSCRYK